MIKLPCFYTYQYFHWKKNFSFFIFRESVFKNNSQFSQNAPNNIIKKLRMGFRISFIVFEIFAFNSKIFQKMPFLAILFFHPLILWKLEEIFENPCVLLLNIILKIFLSNFGATKVKTLEVIKFFPGVFFETHQLAAEALWNFSNFFWKFILVLLRAFRIYMVKGV